MREEAITIYKNISAGLSQCSVLGHILYSLYTADIPIGNGSITAVFADDTATLTTSKNQPTATDNLQNKNRQHL